MEPFDKNPTDQTDAEMVSPEPSEFPTLFVPKHEGYEVPASGQAMIDFKKINEDEEGCTIEVTQFEGQQVEEAEDTMDHVDQFLSKEKAKSNPISEGEY